MSLKKSGMILFYLLKTINAALAKIRKRGDLKRETLDYFMVKDPKFGWSYLLPKIRKRLHKISFYREYFLFFRLTICNH